MRLKEREAKNEFRFQLRTSHRYFSVRNFGYEGYEKIWREVWVSPIQEGQRVLGISSFLCQSQY